MNPGLLLLFLVSVGTIVLPLVTFVALGSDMPPIWALQGLFLFAILMSAVQAIDRTLLFGQPGGPYHWHCGASRRRGGSNSRPISKFPSIKRGTQFLSAVCNGVDTSMAPAI